MAPPLLQDLPYIADSHRLFDAIAGRLWAVFLDSGKPGSSQGRYDILACDPMMTLVTRGAETEIVDRGGRCWFKDDPFELLRKVLSPFYAENCRLPFCGGAIGYFAYDLGQRLERLPSLEEIGDSLPEMAVGIYDWALVVDHQQQRSWLAGQGRDPATQEKWSQLEALFSEPQENEFFTPFSVMSDIHSNMSAECYADAFNRIQHYIREGDCYQVNLAQRFSVETEGEPWLAYKKLQQLNPAPFAAYLNTPDVQILSSSPERFLELRSGEVESKPIKGTFPRGTTPESDCAQITALAGSSKDRAENLMIVDLLRNDLSKSCTPDSVRVPRLFEVETFSTVHHLVSTIQGRLAQGEDAISLLRNCFPGGSITGAPKLRAMEIIEELEPHRRSVYCGSIGYIGFNGDMDSNIAIRTLLHIDGTMRFWAGGGVVADSQLETEYQETFHKVEALIKLLRVRTTPSDHR